MHRFACSRTCKEQYRHEAQIGPTWEGIVFDALGMASLVAWSPFFGCIEH
jgi:hypothetical protein